MISVEAKLTGLDDLKDIIQSNIRDSFVEAGEAGVKQAKAHKEANDYVNRTWNLRNAPGYSVIVKGNELARNIPADSAHGKAEAKTEATLDKIDERFTGIVIANGMHYASFVEAKKYDVLTSASLTTLTVLENKTTK